MQDWDILAIQHLDFFLLNVDCFYFYLAEVQDLRCSMGDRLGILSTLWFIIRVLLITIVFSIETSSLQSESAHGQSHN